MLAQGCPGNRCSWADIEEGYMRILTRKILVSIGLVLCLSHAAYADDEVELSDGPVKEALASSAEELAKMHDGSQIPVYIAAGSTTAPDADVVVEILDNIDASSTGSDRETSSGTTGKAVNAFDTKGGETVIQASGPMGNGTGSSETLVSNVGPGVSSGGTSGSAVKTTAKRMEVINYARQFLGNPYVYGGTSLTEGADCSGFIQSIFKNFGITTGRSSRDQYAKAKTITKEELKPGDLIFYASGDYINHVALYCGNNVIIHAANETTGIATGDAYYREPYGYGRFIFD